MPSSAIHRHDPVLAVCNVNIDLEALTQLAAVTNMHKHALMYIHTNINQSMLNSTNFNNVLYNIIICMLWIDNKILH